MSTRGEMSPPRRRRRTSSPPASLPDDEDLLQEILLRLPPRPSSLLRASLVCKLWRRLVAEPQFRRRFRDHHGKPPLLGFFLQDNISCPFVPMLDPPDRIPGARLSMPPHTRNIIIDCRHGLVLFRSQRRSCRLFVWDPVAREKRRLVFPLGLDNDQMYIVNGAVLRPARGRSSHFQVALIAKEKGNTGNTQVSGCLFSSGTGVWSNIKTLQLDLSNMCTPQPSTLIGNSLCWLIAVHHDHPQYAILEFDLDRQSLAVTELPPHLEAGYDQVRITPGEDCGLGFIHLSHFHARIWKRKPDCDGLAVWVIDRAIEFKELRSNCKGYSLTLVGFVEESNAILVLTASGVFMVYLQSMEFKRLSKLWVFCLHYPFASFYPAELAGTWNSRGDICEDTIFSEGGGMAPDVHWRVSYAPDLYYARTITMADGLGTGFPDLRRHRHHLHVSVRHTVWWTAGALVHDMRMSQGFLGRDPGRTTHRPWRMEATWTEIAAA